MSDTLDAAAVAAMLARLREHSRAGQALTGTSTILSDDQSEAANIIEALWARLSTAEQTAEAVARAEAESARLRAVVERLGSSEAFDLPRVMDLHGRDAELAARMDYARAALNGAPDAC